MVASFPLTAYLQGNRLSIYNVLILFFDSTRIVIFPYSPLLRLLSSQSVSNALFSSCLYEAPPSEKHTVLWLVAWSSVLWLVRVCLGNVPPLSTLLTNSTRPRPFILHMNYLINTGGTLAIIFLKQQCLRKDLK